VSREGAKNVGNITSESFATSAGVNEAVASKIKVCKCAESATNRETVWAESKYQLLTPKTTDVIWVADGEHSFEKVGNGETRKTFEYKAAEFCNPPEARGPAEIDPPSVPENLFEIFGNCDTDEVTDGGSRPLKSLAEGAIKSG
jgi:hypothetical protein